MPLRYGPMTCCVYDTCVQQTTGVHAHHDGSDRPLDAAEDVEAIVVKLQFAAGGVGMHNGIAVVRHQLRHLNLAFLAHARFSLQLSCHRACTEQEVAQQHVPG